jgi:hypothetical protein
MKTEHKIFFLLMLLAFQHVKAQVIRSSKPLQVSLGGIEIYAFPTYSDNFDFHPYHYLPVNMRVSEKNGAPEFSFLTYKKDVSSEIEGGLLHFLLTWGLSSEQETLLDSVFKKQADSLATMMGSLSVEAEGFEIKGKNSVVQILKNTISSEPKVPNFSGGKAAMSFRLDGMEAKEMLKAIKNPKSVDDVYLVFNFKYKSMRGEIQWAIDLKLSDMFTYIGKFPQCVR